MDEAPGGKRVTLTRNDSALVQALRKAVILIGLLPGAVEAQAQKTGTVQPASVSPDRPEGYTIGPGDTLQVVVWKEPELTRDVLVRIDGRATLPLLGDIEAAGRTPKELAEGIANNLSRFVNSPRVTVGISQATSARVYVIGQVVRSGEIPLSVPLTVVQALALSGGFKEFARTDSILVVGRDREVTPFNYKRFEAGRSLEQNVSLKPGDTVVVP
jgi:polysaccharide export outer membrane protein